MDKAKFSCLNFEDDGIPRKFYQKRCKNCGWFESTHHKWERMSKPNGDLGLGWICKRCGRSAYDKRGRCNESIPPMDYPPCSTWDGDGVTD